MDDKQGASVAGALEDALEDVAEKWSRGPLLETETESKTEKEGVGEAQRRTRLCSSKQHDLVHAAHAKEKGDVMLI